MTARNGERHFKGCIADALRGLSPKPTIVGFACFRDGHATGPEDDTAWTVVLEVRDGRITEERMRREMVAAARRAGYQLLPERVHLVRKPF